MAKTRAATRRPELSVIQERLDLKWLLLEEVGPAHHLLDGKVNPHQVDDVWVRDEEDVHWLLDFVGALITVLPGEGGVHWSALVGRFGEALDHHPWLSWIEQQVWAWAVPDDSRSLGDTLTFLPAPPAPEGLEGVEAMLAPLAVQAPELPVVAASSSEEAAPRSRKRKYDEGLEIADDEAPDSKRRPARETRNTWSSERRRQLQRLLAELDTYARLFVGQPDQDPKEAVVAPDAEHDVEIQRVKRYQAPPNARTTFTPTLEYKARDGRFKVQVLDTGVKDGELPRVAGPPFAIQRVAAGAGKTAKGRSYRGTQGFFPNPAFRGVDRGPKPSVRGSRSGDGEVLEFADAAGAAANGLVPQQSSEHEPWVYCVPTSFDSGVGRPDARQGGNPGRQRRQLPEDFDSYAEHRPQHRATVFDTQVPDQSRADASRDPGVVAGNVSSSKFMGAEDPSVSTAYGGGQGRLASHEFCHLVGDGDDGACRSENLGLGTSNCNTEQLAMEATLRNYRARLRRLGMAIRISATAVMEDAVYKAEDFNSSVDWPDGPLLHRDVEVATRVRPRSRRVQPRRHSRAPLRSGRWC